MPYLRLSFVAVVAIGSTSMAARAGEYHLPLPKFIANSQRVERVVRAWDGAVGEGLRVDLGRGGATVSVATDALPHTVRQAKREVRAFVGALSPDVRQFGLKLPPNVEGASQLVVLVHGLDCDGQNFVPLAEKLEGAGYVVARFEYPDDQPIADSAALFQRDLTSFHDGHPETRIEVIAHSMGALVARDAIEGPGYGGGVDRLIMLAPPNHGSNWAHLSFICGAEEQYRLYRDDPRWRWSWSVTDGLGEAASDLLPGSSFLAQLNARPRRAGVKYTIIAGTEFPAQSYVADALEAAHLGGAAAEVREWSAGRDGPVSVRSARLAGVSDFVTLPVDHTDLYYGYPPAAWGVIRERLGG